MTVPRRGGYERRDQSLPRFSALTSTGLGLERSPGSIVTTPARSLAWPNTAQCTRRDCKTFLRNIPAIYGMWLVTLLLLYSFQEGTLSVYFFIAAFWLVMWKNNCTINWIKLSGNLFAVKLHCSKFSAGSFNVILLCAQHIWVLGSFFPSKTNIQLRSKCF